MSLSELAERCEQATGPDRELDCAIYDALGLVDEGHRLFSSGTHSRKQYLSMASPRYTASLDAAMTLVPEGVRETHIVSFASDEGPLGAAWIEGSAYFVRGDAATPALALCGAAIRARTANEVRQTPVTSPSSPSIELDQ